jgi:hypothetical protein
MLCKVFTDRGRRTRNENDLSDVTWTFAQNSPASLRSFAELFRFEIHKSYPDIFLVTQRRIPYTLTPKKEVLGFILRQSNTFKGGSMIIDVYTHLISKRVGAILNKGRYYGEGKEFPYPAKNDEAE